MFPSIARESPGFLAIRGLSKRHSAVGETQPSGKDSPLSSGRHQETPRGSTRVLRGLGRGIRAIAKGSCCLQREGAVGDSLSVVLGRFRGYRVVFAPQKLLSVSWRRRRRHGRSRRITAQHDERTLEGSSRVSLIEKMSHSLSYAPTRDCGGGSV